MSATAPLSAMTLPRTSARRRRTDKVMRGSVLAATIVALVPLVLVIYYLLHKGLSLWFTSGFFTSDPTGSFFGNPGGIRSAILGSLEIVALATVISIPMGIGVALYLTEYGKDSWFANTVRYFVDVMTGVPSIMFGLFIYIVLVVSDFGGSGYAAWKGAVALALLMLPIVIRSAEVVLLLVPSSLREAALALGAPRWRVIFQVVLPTSASGLVTGCLLAVARAMGETAPLALHRVDGLWLDLQPWPADEHDAVSDLHRHHVAPHVDRKHRVGRGANVGRHRPADEPNRPTYCFKESNGMIPPDTTSKAQTDMSSGAGESPDQAQAVPRTPRPGAAEAKAGHAVKLDKLNAYYGDQHALKDVTIDFPPNEVTALIGPSGRASRPSSAASTGCTRRFRARAPRGRSASTSSTSTRQAST